MRENAFMKYGVPWTSGKLLTLWTWGNFWNSGKLMRHYAKRFLWLSNMFSETASSWWNFSFFNQIARVQRIWQPEKALDDHLIKVLDERIKLEPRKNVFAFLPDFCKDRYLLVLNVCQFLRLSKIIDDEYCSK